MPVIPVLAGMEVSGVVFLPERVTRFSEALDSRLEGLRQTAIDTAGGRQFNLASPEQVRIGDASGHLCLSWIGGRLDLLAVARGVLWKVRPTCYASSLSPPPLSPQVWRASHTKSGCIAKIQHKYCPTYAFMAMPAKVLL